MVQDIADACTEQGEEGGKRDAKKGRDSDLERLNWVSEIVHTNLMRQENVFYHPKPLAEPAEDRLSQSIQ